MPSSINYSKGRVNLHIPTKKTKAIKTGGKFANQCTTNFEDLVLVQIRRDQVKKRIEL